VIPSSCLIAKSVNSKSEPSDVANDIMGEVKEHVFGKTVGRMPNQGPFNRRSAPLMVVPVESDSSTKFPKGVI